nr:hypothetical protein [Lachnospiraceae bacterium]
MTKMRPTNQQGICPSCGAPVVSEICSYCGTATGLNTAEADMEYPVLECKEATLGFWTVCFPAIFAVAFGGAGLTVTMVGILGGMGAFMILMGLPFLLIGIVALILMLRTILRYMKIKSKGKVITATVYGYMNDNILINNQPAQIVKLLVQTSNGPRFILYKLGNTLKPYGINDTIDIMVYKDCFMITKNREVAQW